MAIILGLIVVFMGFSNSDDVGNSEGSDGPLELSRKMSKHNNYVRCTRRYTPGMCMEPVVPVWTFVFQSQNCTERLGCPVDLRGNRFGTYDGCLHRCLPLVELYMEILTQEQNNVSSLRIGRWGPSTEFSRDERSFLDEDEDYEVLLRKVTVEGPPPNPMDDDTDRRFQDTQDKIDYYDNEDKKNNLDEDLLKN